MKKLFLSTSLCVTGPAWLANAAHAQQTVTFLCAAPAGHVCQYAVQTGGSQITFALPSASGRKCLASLRTQTNTASATPAR